MTKDTMKKNKNAKAKAKKEKRERIKSTEPREVAGFMRAVPVILIAIALFLTLCFITAETGAFGKFISGVLMGLFSYMAYTIPIFIALHAVFYYSDVKSGRLTHRIVFSTAALVTLSMIAYIIPNLTAEPVFDVETYYSEGTEGHGGGFIGGILAYALMQIFGKVGLIIIIALAIALFAIYFFSGGGSELSTFFLKKIGKLANFGANLEKRSEEKKKRRAEERLAKERAFDDRKNADFYNDEYFGTDNGVSRLEIPELGIIETKSTTTNHVLLENVVKNDEQEPFEPEEPIEEPEAPKRKNPFNDVIIEQTEFVRAETDGKGFRSDDIVYEQTPVSEECSEMTSSEEEAASFEEAADMNAGTYSAAQRTFATAADYGIDDRADAIFTADFDPYDIALNQKRAEKPSSKAGEIGNEPKGFSEYIAELTPEQAEQKRRLEEFEENRRRALERKAAKEAEEAAVRESIAKVNARVAEEKADTVRREGEDSPATDSSESEPTQKSDAFVAENSPCAFRQNGYTAGARMSHYEKVAGIASINSDYEKQYGATVRPTDSASDKYRYVNKTLQAPEEPRRQYSSHENSETQPSSYQAIRTSAQYRETASAEHRINTHIQGQASKSTPSEAFTHVRSYADISSQSPVSAPQYEQPAGEEQAYSPIRDTAPKANPYAKETSAPGSVFGSPSSSTESSSRAPRYAAESYGIDKASFTVTAKPEEPKTSAQSPIKAEEPKADNLSFEEDDGTDLTSIPTGEKTEFSFGKDEKDRSVTESPSICPSNVGEPSLPDGEEISKEAEKENSPQTLEVSRAMLEPEMAMPEKEEKSGLDFSFDDDEEDEGEDFDESDAEPVVERVEIPENERNPEILKLRNMFTVLDGNEEKPEVSEAADVGYSDGNPAPSEQNVGSDNYSENDAEEADAEYDDGTDGMDSNAYEDSDCTPDEEDPDDEAPFDVNEPIYGTAPKTAPKEPSKAPEKPKAPKPDYSNYKFPPLDLLRKSPEEDWERINEEIQYGGDQLLNTLESFNIKATMRGMEHGPRITRYSIVPAKGVRTRQIENLADDIALALAAESIRIEAPIPGKSAVGVEVPNKAPSIVSLRDLLESDEFMSEESKTCVCIGKSVEGSPVYGDIGTMPHVLIAGATGMGKSVCINALITSMLYKARPDEVKFIMIDPKKVEFAPYNGIPHLLVPVVTEPKQAAGALMWAVDEMNKRYDIIEKLCVKSIDSYNKKVAENPELGAPMPKIVIFIDELNDLMVQVRDPVENLIMLIAQKARAAGIHLVIGTQRPSVDVITGVIKANIPSRIACKVSSGIDSRTIIEQTGAEKLIGKGDMLFAPAGKSPKRVQGAFVSESETESIVDFIKSQVKGELYDETAMEDMKRAAQKCDKNKDDGMDDDDGGASGGGCLHDRKFLNAVELAIRNGSVATSFLQRKLHIGYGKAAQYIDDMEALGIVGEKNGAKARDVLISMAEWNEKYERLTSV